jgi:hypothetical protein
VQFIISSLPKLNPTGRGEFANVGDSCGVEAGMYLADHAGLAGGTTPAGG